MLRKEATQFCLSTALHGYRFIALPKRLLLERFVWITVCIISLASAIALVSISWIDFQDDPIVTVTDSNHHPIWHYEFPSVTICDLNKISRKGANRLSKKLLKGVKDEKLAYDLRSLTHLLGYNFHKKDFNANLTRLQDLLDERNMSINVALSMLSTKCENLLVNCLWKGDQKRCETIFERVKTTQGFCCSFNYFALKNHTFGGIVPFKSALEPRRVSACGYLTGLEVLLNVNPNEYFAPIIPSIGAMVIIHNPYDYPDWNTKFSIIRMKTVNFIGLNPKLTYSSENVKRIPKSSRQCWFPNEKTLYYFSRYTFHNCRVECRMNLTLKYCGCMSFFDVPIKGVIENPGRICDLRDVQCLYKNANLIRNSIPGYNYTDIRLSNSQVPTTGRCGCLPDCEVTGYDIESSSGILSRKYSMNHQTLYSSINLANHSVIRIFFNDLVGFKHRKEVRFNWHTLLAFYGGLLGFFMGFSFISGIEIIYFFTIRVLINLKNKHSNQSNRNLFVSIKKRRNFV